MEYKSLRKTIKRQHLIYYSLKKYGFMAHKFEVLERCSIETANDREIFYIKHYNSFYYNNKKGMNLTKGGDGSTVKPGFKHSKKSRRNMSKGGIKFNKIWCYKQNGKLYAVFKSMKSASQKLNINQSFINASINNKVKHAKGYRFFKEKQVNLKEISSTTTERPIVKFSKDGIFLEEYKSVLEAEKLNNLSNSAGGIIRCAKRRTITAFGYKWMYKDECPNLLYVDRPKMSKNNPNCIKINKLDSNNNIVKTYKSATELKYEEGWDFKTIRNYLNRRWHPKNGFTYSRVLNIPS